MTLELNTTENYFIRLILETDNQQAKLLLRNPTHSQIVTLSEISRKLITLELPTKYKRTVSKNRKLLQSLAKSTSTKRTLLSIIKKNVSKVLGFLRAVKDILMTVL